MVLSSSPVAVTSPSDFAPASSKEFLDIQATIECGFTLKRVCDMARTYSLIFIINWIFHVSDFLRSFMISFKYGLVLLRYSSTDTVFLSPLLLYSIWLLLWNLFTITGL